MKVEEKKQFMTYLAGKELMIIPPSSHLANNTASRKTRISEQQAMKNTNAYLVRECNVQLLDKNGSQTGYMVNDQRSGWNIFVDTAKGWYYSQKIQITNLIAVLSSDDSHCHHQYLTGKRLLELLFNFINLSGKGGKPFPKTAVLSSTISVNTVSTGLSSRLSLRPPLRLH